MTSGEMKNELYTVRQVAHLAGVGIKTLHHYDAVGLLRPFMISQAGYRLYGRAQLERLQQILFYRELGFPLKDIHTVLNGAGERLAGLRAQRELLLRRQAEFARLVATIDRTIASAEKGDDMPDHNLFEGFRSEAEWNAVLAEHNAHLKAEYGYDAPPVADAGEQNAAAAHAAAFMNAMSEALRAKRKVGDPVVRELVRGHIDWMVAQGHATGPESFVAQTQYFLDDDFHYAMLENHQTGLSAYLNAAARAYLA